MSNVSINLSSTKVDWQIYCAQIVLVVVRPKYCNDWQDTINQGGELTYFTSFIVLTSCVIPQKSKVFPPQLHNARRIYRPKAYSFCNKANKSKAF